MQTIASTERPASPPKPESKRFSLQPKLQFIVSSIIILATLYIARGFLLPVFAALLLSYALVPAVRILVRMKIPRVLAALLVVGASFLATLYAIIALTGPAITWLEKAPESFDKLESISSVLKRPVENVNAATEQLNKMTKSDGEGKEPVLVRIQETNIIDIVLSQTPIVIGATLSTMILLFFLLAFGNLLLKRIVEASPDLAGKRHSVETARVVEANVSRYLVTVTIINATLGFSVGFALFLLEFESPVLWGTIAALLNFIPYLGAFAGVGLLALASLSTQPNLELALLPPSIYLVLTVIEGNFLTPLILGKSFSINPIFIILVLLFLGWLWGVPGAVMAVPILVAVKSAANSFESSRPLAIILSK
ncbi:AI-2E family transporter [Pelagicoccus sp. SDUM812003]|uniref:AI-2E family transporter n=1 Tax=Pelagicoccus sp. SDUM812003 TaxID=3041267 RepID=UPI002810385E|nr:AI-2E family transporter [Pelagicoccus sp. SDUM812003]MDQ8203980.1 AI-2E family transporter [Pelagicoccus sp. SDUM812003]